MHVCVHVVIALYARVKALCMNIHIHFGVYVCMYIYIRVCLCVFVCVCLCNVYIYVHMEDLDDIKEWWKKDLYSLTLICMRPKFWKQTMKFALDTYGLSAHVL